MPDPQGTREWAPQTQLIKNVETGELEPLGGPDEVGRVAEAVVDRRNAPSREYAASMEGGPDELARGGDGFAERAADVQAKRATANDARLGLTEKIDDVEAAAREMVGAMPEGTFEGERDADVPSSDEGPPVEGDDAPEESSLLTAMKESQE